MNKEQFIDTLRRSLYGKIDDYTLQDHICLLYTSVLFWTEQTLIESLILAQDERWRRA